MNFISMFMLPRSLNSIAFLGWFPMMKIFGDKVLRI